VQGIDQHVEGITIAGARSSSKRAQSVLILQLPMLVHQGERPFSSASLSYVIHQISALLVHLQGFSA